MRKISSNNDRFAKCHFSRVLLKISTENKESRRYIQTNGTRTEFLCCLFLWAFHGYHWSWNYVSHIMYCGKRCQFLSLWYMFDRLHEKSEISGFRQSDELHIRFHSFSPFSSGIYKTIKKPLFLGVKGVILSFELADGLGIS